MNKVITISTDHGERYLQTESSGSMGLYRECAQEFHETGHVCRNKQGMESSSCNVSLRTLLLFLVICASLASGITPIIILSTRMNHEVEELSSQLAMQVAQMVVSQVNLLIVPGPAMCNTVARMFHNGLASSHLESGLDSPELQDAMKLLWGTFRDDTNNPVTMLYMGTEYDAFLGFVDKGPDGIWVRNRTNPQVLAPGPGLPTPQINTSVIEASTAYRALGGSAYNASIKLPPIPWPSTRQRGWYATFATGNASFGWYGPYVYASGALGISAARRLYNSTGQFFGVVAADVSLDGIHTYLSSAQMRLAVGIQHIIIDTQGHLMGSSLPDAISSRKDSTGQTTWVDILDPQQPQDLRDIVQFLKDRAGGKIAGITTDDEVLTWQDWYLYARVLEDNYNLKWIYILFVPQNDFLGPGVASKNTSIGVCTGIVAAVVVVALGFAYSISRRLSILTQDMKRATALALNEIQTGRGATHLQEIHAISLEFNRLVNALRSFQKYLPQDQVGFLLRSNIEANLAAIDQDITVIFIDIANFTTMVEGMTEVETVRFYGSVMTQLSDTIADHEGTLDKYIGDAIMAFWNMPRRVVGHETKAVEAALACRELLPVLKARGWGVDFRAGISSGRCQVGNFGSKGRLNYTAIGDTVNVASRLEGLCKQYYTHTLLSGSTFARLEQSKFVVRLVDNAILKGKGIPTAVYQAMALKSKATADLVTMCTDYEKALSFYNRRQFSDAELIWKSLAARGDATAQMMLQRMATTRYQADFDGVWKWTTK